MKDEGFFYDCAAFQRELDNLSTSEYIAVLRRSEECGYGPHAHLYHECFSRMPSFSDPFGQIARSPCIEVAIGIARIRARLARLSAESKGEE